MPEKPDSREWMKLSGLGVELVAAVGGAVALGYWWDRHFGTSPWGIVGWGAVGLVGGIYNLIRQSLLAFKDAGSGTKAGKGITGKGVNTDGDPDDEQSPNAGR